MMGVLVVWLVSARPPRAYPARIAALARAPFATRKGRGSPPAWVSSCAGLHLRGSPPAWVPSCVGLLLRGSPPAWVSLVVSQEGRGDVGGGWGCLW